MKTMLAPKSIARKRNRVMLKQRDKPALVRLSPREVSKATLHRQERTRSLRVRVLNTLHWLSGTCSGRPTLDAGMPSQNVG
jgi:hypothetical protein